MKHKIRKLITSLPLIFFLGHAGGAIGQTSGPIAWWPGDGNANDVAGSNHGTLHNGATFAPGRIGQAFSFDGVDDFVSFGTSIGNFGTSDFTVEFWVRKPGNRFEAVLGKRLICAFSSMWDIRGWGQGGHPSNPDALIPMAVVQDSGVRGAIIVGDITGGDFHHVAYTRQGTTLRGYRDGIKEDEVITAAVADMSNSEELRAGLSPCTGFPSGFFDGTFLLTGEMDEIKLYDRALSESEIAGAAGLRPMLTCTGFDAPLNGGPVKVKKNRVLPLKAQLIDENSQPADDLGITAPPVVQVIFDNGVSGAVDVSGDALPAGAGSDGNQFEFLDSRWRYNLRTKNYSASGTYTVTMESGDTDEYLIEDPTCTGIFVID